MNTMIGTSMSPEMQALKTRLRTTWMSGPMVSSPNTWNPTP